MSLDGEQRIRSLNRSVLPTRLRQLEPAACWQPIRRKNAPRSAPRNPTRMIPNGGGSVSRALLVKGEGPKPNSRAQQNTDEIMKTTRTKKISSKPGLGSRPEQSRTGLSDSQIQTVETKTAFRLEPPALPPIDFTLSEAACAD